VTVDADKTARLGVPARDVLNLVEAVGVPMPAISPGTATVPLVVRLPDRSARRPSARGDAHSTAVGPIVT